MKILLTVVFAASLAMLFNVPFASGGEVNVSPTAGCQQGTGSGSFDCLSLSDALRIVSSSATLYLDPGTHHIDQFTPVYGLHDVSIVGVGGGGDGIEAVITCADGVGLAFVNITNLAIQNVRIEDCGLTGQNLTEAVALLDGVVEIFFKVPSEATIAVFLGHVENLTMQHAVVTNTSGLGLVGINVIGLSTISQVDFTFNIRPSSCFFPSGFLSPANVTNPMGRMIGGGAYFLYQDYSPAYQNMYHDQQYSLSIDESNFSKNSECTLLVFYEARLGFSEALQEVGYAIGGAGGLGLMLAQLHYGMEITTTSALIQGNSAVVGSGVHIGIFSGVRDSRIMFSYCTFIMNGFPSDVLITRDQVSAAGGGLAIFNDLIRPKGIESINSFRNRNVVVNISNSNFTENRVQAGAGAYIYSVFASPIREILFLDFNNCVFKGNMAYIGSAIYIFETKTNGVFPGMQVSLNTVLVRNNRIVTSTINSDFTVSPSHNSAILDIRGINFTISGDSTFSDNIGTALLAEQSVVGIAGNVTFEKNTGTYGGAMRLIRNSYLIVTSGSRLYLRENVGRVVGGALYVDLLGGQSLAFSFDDCFLFFDYDDYIFCNDCSDLNSTGVNIEFSDNVAPFGSIVYGSALRQCPWAVPLHQKSLNPLLSTFQLIDRYFPNIVNFSNNNPQGVINVFTLPTALYIENELDTYSISPGEQFYLNVSAFDSFFQNVPAVLSSYVISNQPLILQNMTASLLGRSSTTVPVRIFGTENQTLMLVLFSGAAQTQISVELGFCGTGFEYNNVTLTCTCSPILVSEGIDCDITNHALIVPNDLWFGPVTSGGDLAVRRCLTGYCKSGTRYVSVNNGSVNYDVQCNPDLNRVGILCGSCQDGYSITLGSERCLQCSNSYVVLFFIFALLGIFLIFSISYLRITITAGYLHGPLFYANIVVLYGRILIPTDTSGGKYVLASFLTLNLGIETCLHSELTSLERVWWQLSFPLYLFFLMILTALVVMYCKCFKVSRGAGLSTIQAFATLMIACYVSVLQSCVELLVPVNIATKNGHSLLRWMVNPTVPYLENAHLFLAVAACILIVIYVIPLPLFLLSSELVYRISYFSKFKSFYDAFWDPFEPHFRFWLGLRLIFRWVPFPLIYLIDSLENAFVIDLLLIVLLFFQLMFKPFIGKWRNALDSYFLLILIILFSGSLYFGYRAEFNCGAMRQQVLEQQTIFSTVFISLGYLGFIVVLVFHIFHRFPRLKDAFLKLNCYRKKSEIMKVVAAQNIQTHNELPAEDVSSCEDSTSDSGHPESQTNRPPPVVTFSELRDSMLLGTYGSVDITTIPHPETQT